MPQRVVFVSGAPGVGKSTVARRVASALGASLVDIDATVAPFAPLLVGEKPELVRRAVYDSLLGTVEASLAAGIDVVVAAPFTRERRESAAWAEAAGRVRARGAEPVLVWLHASHEVVLARLTERGAARDAEKLTDPERWLEQADPGAPPAVPHVAVAASGAPEEAADLILRALEPEPRIASAASPR